MSMKYTKYPMNVLIAFGNSYLYKGVMTINPQA